MAAYDAALRAKHGEILIGCDEAGRGAWSGPICAGACVLPTDPEKLLLLKGLDDSKKMTPEGRKRLAEVIKSIAVAWHVEYIYPEAIDSKGIQWANKEVMRIAMGKVERQAGLASVYVLDQSPAPNVSPLVMASKMDGTSLSCAAAACLAKTERDAMMQELDKQYPGYNLADNKGYIHGDHVARVNKLGRIKGLYRYSYSVKGHIDPESAQASLSEGSAAYEASDLRARKEARATRYGGETQRPQAESPAGLSANSVKFASLVAMDF